MRTELDLTRPISEQPAYLRIADVAALMRRSKRTIAHWEAQGLLRVIRPAGGAPLIERSEIERLISEGQSR